MRKLFLLIAFIGMSQLSIAQSENSEFKEDALKMIKLSNNAVEASFGQIYSMIPEENLEDFKKEIQPIMDRYYEKMAVISMDYYTHDEIKQLLEFYNSELGQKSIEAQGKIMEKAMQMGQQLSTEMMPILQKYRN
jgi:hypothetical protein